MASVLADRVGRLTIAATQKVKVMTAERTTEGARPTSIA
jgi:hypothetical protein